MQETRIGQEELNLKGRKPGFVRSKTNLVFRASATAANVNANSISATNRAPELSFGKHYRLPMSDPPINDLSSGLAPRDNANSRDKIGAQTVTQIDTGQILTANQKLPRTLASIVVATLRLPRGPASSHLRSRASLIR